VASDPILPEAFQARAFLIAARLDLHKLTGAEVIARAPLAIRVAGGGIAVLFRYGAVVMFGVAPAAEDALRRRLLEGATHKYRAPDAEQLEVRVQEGIAEGLADGSLRLHAGSVERLQLIAEVLARSLLLAHYETRLAAEFDSIEPLALELDRRGTISGGTREHLKRIGALLLVEHRMVGRAGIGEKPELVWEHPRLERLHGLLEGEFEIRERLAGLDRKLELAARTERTLVELISTRHALRVEWYIVALFVLEIALAIYGMAVR
jgi:uncharacterized Rmd1/YagE family protein